MSNSAIHARKKLRIRAWLWLSEAGFIAPSKWALNDKHFIHSRWAKRGAHDDGIDTAMWEAFKVGGDEAAKATVLQTAMLIGLPKAITIKIDQHEYSNHL